MKPILSALVLVLMATTCDSHFQPSGDAANPEVQVQAPPEEEYQASEVSQAGNVPASGPTSIPNEIILSPTAPPIPTLLAPVVVSDEPEAPEDPVVAADIGVFATMPDNIATGQAAPDFDVRALENRTFTLSASRGSYVLVFPTVIGCGDCVFTMGQLAAAYSDYQDANLKLVLLNIYPEDVPETWGEYIDLYPELDAIWAVINGIDFVVDYEVRSLGTILLIDPDGRLVYRRNYSLGEEEFRQLFSLIIS